MRINHEVGVSEVEYILYLLHCGVRRLVHSLQSSLKVTMRLSLVVEPSDVQSSGIEADMNQWWEL